MYLHLGVSVLVDSLPSRLPAPYVVGGLYVNADQLTHAGPAAGHTFKSRLWNFLVRQVNLSAGLFLHPYVVLGILHKTRWYVRNTRTVKAWLIHCYLAFRL